jgi:transglutaminase-like putative cysteine protease
MRYRIDHTTRVSYRHAIRGARFNVRLRPVAWPGQRVSDFTLSVEPEPSRLEQSEGHYPVHLARIEIADAMEELVIRTRFHADAEETPAEPEGPDIAVAEAAALALATDDLGAWSPLNYLFPSPLLPALPDIAEWAVPLLPPDAPVLSAGLALARTIYRDFKYDSRATEADTPVGDAFAMRAGVCQDFAHVLIVAFRAAGLPAAYVSGYLRTTPPPGKPRLVGVDAMHAWVALWCGPARGWVGLDPTNGCIAGSGHIFAALGRDYADVSPIDGIFVGGGAQRLETAVDVMPIGE